MDRRLGYTLIVLCGGQGSRLGGADKGLLKIDGQLAVRRLIERLADPADRRASVLINANRHYEQYQAMGYPVIADQRDGFQGPLAGVEACLQHVTAGPVLIVPADMPDLPADLPQRLLGKLTGQSIVIAHDGEQSQPLCMVMYPIWLESITRWLDSGGRSVHRWLSDKPVQYEYFSDASEFSNINEKSDLQRKNGQFIQLMCSQR
jgi:molybdenum cofactor guanylyltransferase